MSASAHPLVTPPVPHVVLVITKGEAGGAQTHVMELCRALQGRVRFSVVIGGVDVRSVLGQALGDLGITVLALPSLQNSLNPLKVITSVRALLAHVRVLQPDVIHAHSAVAGVIARLAGKLRQIPVVYTVHGFGFKPQAPWLIRTNAWLAEAALAAWTTRWPMCPGEATWRLSGRALLAVCGHERGLHRLVRCLVLGQHLECQHPHGLAVGPHAAEPVGFDAVGDQALSAS